MGFGRRVDGRELPPKSVTMRQILTQMVVQGKAVWGNLFHKVAPVVGNSLCLPWSELYLGYRNVCGRYDSRAI